MNHPIVTSPPLLFRAGKFLNRNKLRGGYRIIALANRLGMLNVVVRYDLGLRAPVDIPLYRPDNCWDADEAKNYEFETIDLIAQFAAKFRGPAMLVDCGADIGLISARIVAACPSIARMVAFEPNLEAFRILESNVKRLPIPGECRPAGVGARAGRGSLRRPQHEASDHAQFVEASDTGDFAVYAIDDLGIEPGGNVVIKIDVEGGEMDVIKGARRTLSAARDFIIVYEAHPKQVERTKIDPFDIYRVIRATRDCSIYVCEHPDLALDTSRPFFDHVDPRLPYNVLCTTLTAP